MEKREIVDEVCRNPRATDFELPPACVWNEAMGFDEDFWETGCDNAFTCMTGIPSENKFKFCPYCGRPIKEVRRALTGLD